MSKRGGIKMVQKPILWIIIPCYNEETVLPMTAPLFLHELNSLIYEDKICEDSRILFVNDGSKDNTWDIICKLAEKDLHYIGISQSRNRGHQNAVWAGMMEAKEYCDIIISIDCDGQDDINAMHSMIDEYYKGNDIVYGVRSKRKIDSFFKRFTAESFYKILNKMGVEVIYNHADYRLLSSVILHELENFRERNLFLRGMIPLVGFESSKVYYERQERIAGQSHYPLRKMISLAFDGITSLSIRPIRIIMGSGFFVALMSFVGILWAIFTSLMGKSISGWASIICVMCFIGGIQLICLGVIGEYIGKMYIEVKNRPRYIISKRTNNFKMKNTFDKK